MRNGTPQDTGHAQWFMFIPDVGVFVIPTRVRIEDREVWRESEQVTSGPGRHLAVVR